MRGDAGRRGSNRSGTPSKWAAGLGYKPRLLYRNAPIVTSMLMKEELGRTLVVLGVVLMATGFLFLFGDRLPFRLGRLPGDISWESERGSFHFPITTCILLSVVISFLFWLFSRR
jgi:hypothetical protein